MQMTGEDNYTILGGSDSHENFCLQTEGAAGAGGLKSIEKKLFFYHFLYFSEISLAADKW